MVSKPWNWPTICKCTCGVSLRADHLPATHSENLRGARRFFGKMRSRAERIKVVRDLFRLPAWGRFLLRNLTVEDGDPSIEVPRAHRRLAWLRLRRGRCFRVAGRAARTI